MSLGEKIHKAWARWWERAVKAVGREPPEIVEGLTIFSHCRDGHVGQPEFGVRLTCDRCSRKQPVIAVLSERKHDRYSIYRYLEWELPKGWHRVTVDGKESLVCDQHECLAPRP